LAPLGRRGPRRSKHVLRRQLDDALSGLSRHQAERSARRIAVRAAPVRVVQHVEGLHPELNSIAAADGHDLPQSHIEVPCVRIAQRIPRLQAERSRRNGSSYIQLAISTCVRSRSEMPQYALSSYAFGRTSVSDEELSRVRDSV